jgi:hypothetical protein
LGQSAKGANWLQQQMSKYPDNPILKWVQKAGMSTTLHELPSISIQLEDATMRLLRKL